MGIFTDWFRSEPTQLKLDAGYGNSKIGLPMAPPLDVSLDSLLKYSKRSELVYACIEKKAQAACDAELVVEKRVNGEWEPVDSHPLTNLLNKPNQWDDGESFIRAWIASENFSDYFYCEIVRSGAGVPVGLYPLNPVYLWPQYVGNRLDHYIYNSNGYPARLEVDDLLIRRRHGAASIYSGVSNVQIALGSIDADSAMTEYVRAFFNNGGHPSGIVNLKGRKLSDTEARAYQQAWQARFGRGGNNAQGIAIFDADQAEYQEVGAKLNDLGGEELAGRHETRICMAFGVPPILIGTITGLKHVTQNATSKAAMTDFWQYTMSPELKSIRKFLTWNLLPMFEGLDAIKKGNIRVNWDMAQVAALQPDLDAVINRTVKAYQGGLMKLNEARSDIKLDALDGDEADLGESFFKQPTPTVNFGQAPEPVALPPVQDPKQITDGKADLIAGWKELAEKIEAVMPLATAGKALNCPGCNLPDAKCTCELIEEIEWEDCPLEKKTFEFNGLTLGREPTALEQSIDLKGMVQDFEDGKVRMSQVVLSIRDKLIVQSVSVAKKTDPKTFHELTLTPPEGAYNGISKVVQQLFETGRKQVVKDLNRQKSSGSFILETKDLRDEWKAFLQRIADRTISRIINEIQTRAINFFVSRGLLDKDDDAIIAELRAALEDQSTVSFDRISQEAANAALGEGREAELTDRADEILMYEYSAILDSNVCSPCEESDGMQAKDMADLPPAPNDECLGGGACRCVIIGIGHEENA